MIWYKEEIKENNAWFIYAIGVNFAEGIFMYVKVTIIHFSR